MAFFKAVIEMTFLLFPPFGMKSFVRGLSNTCLEVSKTKLELADEKSLNYLPVGGHRSILPQSNGKNDVKTSQLLPGVFFKEQGL